MPFRPEDIGWSLSCGPGPDGRWHGWFDVRVRAEALRPLGLHPDQPTARPAAGSPPAWWHAAADRAADGIWPLDS
ncbi:MULTISPECIES: hypothetical protein [Streptomyces]|uniref:Uncharacterized protein n=1 Tax=Streptomyces solicathayae TaxID=3081768 RepID=A0ABZ0LLC3_9ACTN|nr:hypothetical protein [Streptomyces sp. HUAS YS2]WOX20221.1 hypothetical protein R2D22_01970 [Streptomyces sp. HUAS YS2]